MAYEDLNIRERAAVIRAGVQNGMTRLADIKAKYNEFVSEENNPDYDMQSWAKENPSQVFNHQGHYTDKFKRPNHPTFSDESIYSTPQTPGGHWGDGTFEPSEWMLDKYGATHIVEGLKQQGDSSVTPIFRGGRLLPDVNVTANKLGKGGSTVKKGDYLGKIASQLGVTIADIVAANPGLNPDKIKEGQVLNLPNTAPRKVDFTAYMQSKGANRNRPMNISAMEQLQDSLIMRGFNEPQRLAILGTAAQEMDDRGAASIGVGGNGYLGLSESRMPVSLLDDTPKGRGKQINYVLEDLTHVYTGTHPQAGNWNHGGTGGPKITNGQDGSNQFWNAADVRTAVQVLNKSYIRPAGGLDSWNNRAAVAEGMQKFMKTSGGYLHSTGGPLYPFSFSKVPLPSVRY